LSACLGLSFAYDKNEIRFEDPRLPDFLADLTIRGLQLGETRADIRLRSDGDGVTVSVLSRDGTARLVQTK
jgi:hypothetical protein